MRYLFFSAATALFLTAQVVQVAAQVEGALDDEFAAFKKTVAGAKVTAALADTKVQGKPADSQPAEQVGVAGDKSAAISNPLSDAADKQPMLGNPLGLAADLPVKGQLPAVSNALAPPSPEEAQQQLEEEAAEQEKKAQQKTFDDALKQLMPLTPEQIRALYAKFRESRQAAETPIQIPETKTVVQTISLDPSQAAPVVRTTPGYVTTLSILDSTGAPWPIQDISFAGKFDITPPEEGGHVVRITPSSAHGVGNMSVRLVDMITPVIFTLATGLDETDYRFDARIAKTGPLAKTPIIEFGGISAVAGTDQNLMSVLDGTVPSGAEKLSVKGVDGRTTAWRVEGRIYLRTPLSLLSPAWDSSVASADGTTVYTMNDAPVILLSDEGKMVRARIAAADEVSP